MKIRKQINELTVDDFKAHPAWEFAMDEEGEEGQDECTVRPYKSFWSINASKGAYLVLASFVLADGSKMQGYLTPPQIGDEGLSRMQPVIITAGGQVGFWCGSLTPPSERLSNWYHLLGRDAPRVFPVQFKSEVALNGPSASGTIDGFMVLEDFQTGKCKILT